MPVSEWRRARPNCDLVVRRGDGGSDSCGGSSDCGNSGVDNVLHVCVPVGGESDKAKRSGFIQGGAFFLSDIVKTLQSSGETDAREDGNVQGRRDQIFAAAHC